jgi:peptidoglycan biosynthesis/recognition FemAB-like protein
MSVHRYSNFKEVPGSELFSEKIPVFAAQNYCDYLKEIKNHDTIWFVNLENNKVTHLLPFAIIKKMIFKKGYFVTGVISLAGDNSLESEKEFLENVIADIKKNNLCDWIQQGPNWALFNTIPAGSIAVRFGTYRITLNDKNEDELFKLIQKRNRQDINNAVKNGIEIKRGRDYLNDCLAVINNTAIEGNLQSLSLNETERLLYYFKDKCKIYVSYKDDIAQSATIFLSNDYCTYALFSGSIYTISRGANAYLFWEVIKDAKQNNCRYFDFVGARINPLPGSKQERIQQFKKHFGCDLVQGYIWKMNISAGKYYIYQIFVRMILFAKRKKYLPDIIDQEMEVQKNEKNYSNS